MPVPPRTRPIELVERLRWGLPILIFLFVVFHQLFTLDWIDPLPTPLRFIAGLLVYGLIGPLMAWWVFTWIAAHLREQQRIEQQMREREQYLASITTASSDAIMSVDTCGCIQSWNQGAQTIFGWTADEILGQSMDVLVPAERQARGEPANILVTVAKRGAISHYETEWMRKDSRHLVVDVTSNVLTDATGQMIGSATIIRDITARKRAEEQVRELNRELEKRVDKRTRQLNIALQQLQGRADELERANEELTELDHLKSEFVSMVSHELRAPLTNINGSVELLVSDTGLEPGQRAMLHIIREQTQRLTRLVQGILNVSRIEAGRLTLHQEPLDVSYVLTRVAKNTRGAPPRDIEVDLPAYPLMAWADLDRVEEVLVNLVDNALKYSPPDTPVRLSGYNAAHQIVIAVSDNGIGIPPDQLERIFEKFHRLEQGDNRETYGHGLGLYIARGLVQALGGRMWAESMPGRGSTFYFTLPQAYASDGLPGASRPADGLLWPAATAPTPLDEAPSPRSAS
ncbi:MAG: PAS domain S-box protein [Anaerolineae bacterium]|nr:PAS domain S-box protein [Anaerolineae bacterium]